MYTLSLRLSYRVLVSGGGAESLLSGHTKDFALRGLAKMNKSAAYHSARGVWEVESGQELRWLTPLTVLPFPELSQESQNSKQ